MQVLDEGDIGHAERRKNDEMAKNISELNKSCGRGTEVSYIQKKKFEIIRGDVRL